MRRDLFIYLFIIKIVIYSNDVLCSLGGHGAWMLSVSAPEAFKCVAAVSSWIRKEEYANGNDFFNLDASKPFVAAATVHAASLLMSEYHVDTLAANLKELDVLIRVGSQDKTTNPWFSRRMVR